MKIRNGFVSNSSSSSFVVVLPDDFKLDCDDELVQKLFAIFMKEGVLYRDYWLPTVKGENKMNVAVAARKLHEYLLDYSVSRIETGSDDGNGMFLVKNDRIRELWAKKTP